MQKTVDVLQLRALIAAGAVKDVWIAGTSAGWAVSIDGKWLITQRKEQRLFAKVETALGTLRELGLGKGRISWDQWTPEQASIR